MAFPPSATVVLLNPETACGRRCTVVGGEDVDYRIRTLQAGFVVKYCSAFALHFNARMVAKFLSTKAKERNIKRIEGKITKLINDDNLKIENSGQNIDKITIKELINDLGINELAYD